MEEDYEKGFGWLMFASLMLLIAGAFNIIWGIAAVANSSVWVGETRFVFGTLNTWGWIWLIVGILEVCAGLGIFTRNQWARWFGIVMAALGSILAFFHIWSQPGWAILIIALDVLVLYALAVYGGREEG